MLHKSPGDNAKIAVLLSDVSNSLQAFIVVREYGLFWFKLECRLRIGGGNSACFQATQVLLVAAITDPEVL